MTGVESIVPGLPPALAGSEQVPAVGVSTAGTA